ncbi:Calcium ion binding [Blomia tropicalis]|nr:Calcium ion binding [Blomia tropicalis]
MEPSYMDGDLIGPPLFLFMTTIRAQLTNSDNLLHCPEDWRREGIYCYRFFNIRHSWRRAAEICRRILNEHDSIEFDCNVCDYVN